MPCSPFESQWTFRRIYHLRNEDGSAVTVTSGVYVEMSRNFLTRELSSRPYDSIRMVQLPIQPEHPWRSFGKYEYFRSALFHCAASYHGLHDRLISLPVIISFADTSKRKGTTIDYGPSWPQDRNSEVDFGDSRTHGDVTTGKPLSEVGRVCMQ
jgi:hypothetical protein